MLRQVRHVPLVRSILPRPFFSTKLTTTSSNGQQPIPGYQGPSCPTANCGICYRVTNQGGYGGSDVGGVGNSVVVQIIDSCPASHADNFCKTNVPGDERCAPGSNTMDIDQSAYQALTGQPLGSVSYFVKAG